jgi:hypothetical protein
MSKVLQKIKSVNYENDYDRLIKGERLSDSNRPYTTDFIKELISYFEDLEEYEKCSNLILVIKKIENHNQNYIDGR